ncbi:hypothetical protein MMC16_007191 [Acarospora aff. strigata]|nr:hypothetical protein [Acarospora aff. strigata]
MVPRSFLYSSPLPLPSGRRIDRDVPYMKDSTRSTKARVKNEMEGVTPNPSTASPASSGVPSKPMIIPLRAHQEGSRRNQRYTSITRVNSNPKEVVSDKHDPHALPPAVAALLAVTSIPQHLQRHAKGSIRVNKKQGPGYAQQVRDVRIGDSESRAGFSPTSLDLLLSPPEDLDDALATADCDPSTESEATVRSLSSESIPSLENDGESTASSSTPPTPGSGGRKLSTDRRQRALSSPRAQDCAFDHPLLSPVAKLDALSYNDTMEDADILKQTITLPTAPSRSYFKSNLTASLRVLKSAARSFSNFTVPVAQRDEFLTRSIMAIQPHITDDRRPLPSHDPPDPVLRRYLNPIAASPAELHMHHYFSVDNERESPCTFSVQLQTYRRSTSKSKKATSPPVFVSRYGGSVEVTSKDPTVTSAPETRQREPRENSDFLRIIVMEMNMRREGKLADDAKGKARLWLPPRTASRKQLAHDGEIPNRWIGLVSGE